MNSFVFIILLSTLLVTSGRSVAQEPNPAHVLVEKMMYSKFFDDAQAACLEQANGYDVESVVAQNPEQLGGIKPGDTRWTEAKAVYTDFLKSGCYYDKEAAVSALEKATAENLTQGEIKQLIAFYDTPLGQRFAIASIIGSNAAGRAAKPLNDTNESSKLFRDRIAELLRQGKPSP